MRTDAGQTAAAPSEGALRGRLRMIVTPVEPEVRERSSDLGGGGGGGPTALRASGAGGALRGANGGGDWVLVPVPGEVAHATPSPSPPAKARA